MNQHYKDTCSKGRNETRQHTEDMGKPNHQQRGKKRKMPVNSAKTKNKKKYMGSLLEHPSMDVPLVKDLLALCLQSVQQNMH